MQVLFCAKSYLIIHKLKCECRLAHTTTTNHDYFVEDQRTLVFCLASSHFFCEVVKYPDEMDELEAKKQKLCSAAQIRFLIFRIQFVSKYTLVS